MKITALIPARYASTRFPGKPLALLGGVPVIERVCRRVAEAGITPVVATDDGRITQAVERAGFRAVMTLSTHRSGTDRICEAMEKLPGAAASDVIVNVQGDEPFVSPDDLRALTAVFADPQVELATLVRDFDPKRGFADLRDPNLVKVVTADNGDALYFSRSVIPYVRGKEEDKWLASARFLTHQGVYAYRPATLRRVASLPPSELEKSESLEQLRWLQAGLRIRTVKATGETIGIDTPEDLAEAEKRLG